MVRVTLQEPSLARARVWAPLSLLLVLACGAWFFRGSGWQPVEPALRPSAPWVGASPAEAMKESGQVDASPMDGVEASKGAPRAAQVLDEVAQRGLRAEPAPPGPLSAESVQARVRQEPAGVHRQTAGQRLRLSGNLASVEAGEPGVVVLHLALPGESQTVRVVASPALARVAVGWAAPKALSLDCLSQGVMMGEWLLVDCRDGSPG